MQVYNLHLDPQFLDLMDEDLEPIDIDTLLDQLEPIE